MYLNKSAAMADNKYGFATVASGKFSAWGAPKTLVTNLTADHSAGVTSLTVSDATGWQVGDRLYIIQTDWTTDKRRDIVTIGSGYTPGATTVPLTAATTYAHSYAIKSSLYVGNFTSNVTIGNYNDTYRGGFALKLGSASNYNDYEMGYTSVMTIGGAYPNYGFAIDSDANYSATAWKMPFKKLYKCAINLLRDVNGTYVATIQMPFCDSRLIVDQCLFVGDASLNNGHYVSAKSGATFSSCTFLGAGINPQSAYGALDFNDCAISGQGVGWFTPIGANIGATFRRCKFGGRRNSGTGVLLHFGAQYNWLATTMSDCDFGTTIPTALNDVAGYTGFLAYTQSLGDAVQITVNNPTINMSRINFPNVTYLNNMSEESFVFAKNINSDTTQQYLLNKYGQVSRNNSIVNRSSSSCALRPISATLPLTREIKISCAVGQTVRVVGYVKMSTAFYNAGDCTYPSVTLSGMGATPVTFTSTSAGNNAWEKYDLSITNSAGYAGTFSLTYSAQAKTVTTGEVYFDGVPDDPFVTQCRHYGFDLTQETSAARVVDAYVVDSESTAAGYSGVAIDGDTTRITFSSGTANTAQKFYDYTRAWSATHLNKDIPLTRAGALYALASGWTVVEPNYDGMTWGGGKVEWSTPGAKSGAYDSNVFTFTTAGTYNFGAAKFSGTVTLVNNSGGAVTVQLPTGTAYTNSGPSITVSVPSVRLIVYGFQTGSDVVIYESGTANVLATGDSVTSPYEWTYAGAQTIDIGVFLPGFVPYRANGVALDGSTASFLVTQSIDRTYSNP
jgi:hypothetical protein